MTRRKRRRSWKPTSTLKPKTQLYTVSFLILILPSIQHIVNLIHLKKNDKPKWRQPRTVHSNQINPQHRPLAYTASQEIIIFLANKCPNLATTKLDSQLDETKMKKLNRFTRKYKLNLKKKNWAIKKYRGQIGSKAAEEELKQRAVKTWPRSVQTTKEGEERRKRWWLARGWGALLVKGMMGFRGSGRMRSRVLGACGLGELLLVMAAMLGREMGWSVLALNSYM